VRSVGGAGRRVYTSEGQRRGNKARTRGSYVSKPIGGTSKCRSSAVCRRRPAPSIEQRVAERVRYVRWRQEEPLHSQRTGSFAAQRQGPVDRLQGRRRAAPSSSGGARPATFAGKRTVSVRSAHRFVRSAAPGAGGSSAGSSTCSAVVERRREASYVARRGTKRQRSVVYLRSARAPCTVLAVDREEVGGASRRAVEGRGGCRFSVQRRPLGSWIFLLLRLVGCPAGWVRFLLPRVRAGLWEMPLVRDGGLVDVGFQTARAVTVPPRKMSAPLVGSKGLRRGPAGAGGGALGLHQMCTIRIRLLGCPSAQLCAYRPGQPREMDDALADAPAGPPPARPTGNPGVHGL